MFLRNKNGFSLIQVMLLSAALSASALVAIQTFKTQKDEIKETDVRDKVEHIHNAIYSILQNRNHCLATIVNSPGSVSIAPNDLRSLTSIILSNPAVATPTVAFTKDVTYLNGSVSIKDMTLLFPPDLKDPALMTIVYNRHGNKRGGDSDVIRKTIRIAIQRSTATDLNGCSSITQADGLTESGNEDIVKELCLSNVLMTWDDTLRKCQIKDNVCPNDKIFTGLDASGNMICKSLIEFLPYVISPSFVQSCPDTFDQIKFNRTFTSPNQVSIECNKKGVTCPSNHALTWTDTPSLCNGYLPRGDDGSIYTATDSTAPVTGTVQYLCSAGSWQQLTPTLVCVAPCAAGTRTWGSNCSGPVPGVKNGVVVSTEDTTLPSIGTANFKCVDGSWATTGTVVCSTPCTTAATKSWSISGNTCSALVSPVNDGDLQTVTDAVPTATGSATFKCVNGSYVLQGSPAATCTSPPTPGTCKWSRVITWENPDCTGFQLNSTPNTSTQAVSSPAQCSALCGVCNGSGASKDTCVFTPL